MLPILFLFGFQIPVSENVLDKDVFPPVLGSAECGVSRATAENTWKEEVRMTVKLLELIVLADVGILAGELKVTQIASV